MKVYIVVCESNLPDEFQYDLEGAFYMRDAALGCIEYNKQNLIKRIDKGEYDCFSDYEIDENDGYFEVRSKKDEFLYIKYYIERMEMY